MIRLWISYINGPIAARRSSRVVVFCTVFAYDTTALSSMFCIISNMMSRCNSVGSPPNKDIDSALYNSNRDTGYNRDTVYNRDTG